MEDGKNGFHYYLQDELGSPLRVSGYERNKGKKSKDRSYAVQDYLTYGYDEFGNDLYRDLEESGIPSPYDKQGEEQPFGYTGYRYDEISGTYFAQAREYQPESGRFTAEDVVKGNGAVPETLNRYGYCWGDPVGFVDNDGRKGYYFYDPDIFAGSSVDVEKCVQSDIERLSEYYGTEIELIKMDSESDEKYVFAEEWKGMDDSEGIEVVVILSPADNNCVRVDTNHSEEGKEEAVIIGRDDIEDLEKKDIDNLILLGCNEGVDNTRIHNRHVTKYDYSIGEAFLMGKNKDTIGKVIASDGTTYHGYHDGRHTITSCTKVIYHANYIERWLYQNKGINLFEDNNLGFRVFSYNDGQLESYSTKSKKYADIVELLGEIDECVN